MQRMRQKGLLLCAPSHTKQSNTSARNNKLSPFACFQWKPSHFQLPQPHTHHKPMILFSVIIQQRPFSFSFCPGYILRDTDQWLGWHLHLFYFFRKQVSRSHCVATKKTLQAELQLPQQRQQRSPSLAGSSPAGNTSTGHRLLLPLGCNKSSSKKPQKEEPVFNTQILNTTATPQEAS